MSTTTVTTPTTAHVTGWDRAVVIALGASGCALSFSALQQMAVAIHVRDFLTYPSVYSTTRTRSGSARCDLPGWRDAAGGCRRAVSGGGSDG
ncbi:hypothetical protein ACIQOW_11350 [Kitasatospora sp. NPDC091335]|uniref:hypothetical protein n=1 Tax=Kitasatospora sp. NPDC091335 TaxID=3364085 RepID=UPI00380F572D